MSLLTPPSSSHRGDKDKENKFSPPPVAGPSTRTVVWADENSIHLLTTPLKHVSIPSKHRPGATKSILKASRDNALLTVPVTAEREVTPEPSDPLVNLSYLDHPVAQILSNSDGEESLGELIEGYNVLAARLRSCVSDATDADASWPLFQPLRKNTQAFVDAVVRDLGRAFVEPLSHRSTWADGDAAELPKYSLPSPQSSPVKKKGGLSEEQVKYARDLCTTCHSVIKLLGVMLSFPAVYNVFQQKQLADILTALLAIPLAEDLPTPNARKTCALAIWLIQVQRLPADVLRPAADRIAYALRRGMDGELGKEGKKGSANDGLKAIHDLCVYLPAVFIPAFTQLLPSVLSNLLASTLALRTQACHALGGFVNGSTSIPLSTCHTKIASTIAAYLTTATPSPAKTAQTKPTEAAIVRTLRTTISNAEPTHVAQGPVWAISVLASFVVLLGSRLCADQKVNRIVSSLLSLGMRHKKSSVRALTCIAWRPIAWAYFQPPLPVEDDEESEVDEDSYVQTKHARLAHCKVMLSVVDCQAGVSTIAALLADESSVGEEALRLSIEIIQNMTSKAGHTCQDAVETLKHMVSLSESDQQNAGEGWDMKLLLPSKLFSANPGLLTTDFKSLSHAVRPVFEQLAMIGDIRCLTRDEMAKDWVFKGLMAAWKIALGCLELCDDAEVPASLVEIWENLLTANVGSLQENGDDDATSTFGCCAIKYLVYILEDPKLNFMPRKPTDKAPMTDAAPGSDDTVPEIDIPNHCTNGELRIRVVRRMWLTMQTIFPHATLRECAELLLSSLTKSEDLLVPEKAKLGATATADEDDGEQARTAWVSMCIDVLSVCDADAVKAFWVCEDDAGEARSPRRRGVAWSKEYTNAVWKTSVQKWKDGEGFWEGGVVLLGVPFTDRHAWNLSGEDFALWEDVLGYTTNKALDCGVDSSNVLDCIAFFVSSFQTPGAAPATALRLVDLLFSHLDAPEMRDLPLGVLELASETMRATYPLEPRYKHFAMWMVRSLATVIENCPPEFCLRLLQVVQEGLCLWLSDECEVWTEHDLTYDVVPLYQYVIVRLQALPESFATLDAVAIILDAVFHNRAPALAVEAFTDYWNLTYARISPPEEGWSGPIRHCLCAVGILPPEEPDLQAATTVASDVPSSPLASAFNAQLSSPRTPIASSFSTPPTAVLRREALSRVPSPQRPQKVFGTFPIVPSTPLSPVRRRTWSSSERRTPLSSIQLCGSPTKRRRLMSDENNEEDKENLAIGSIVPVADRIAELAKPSAKKRRREEDEEEEKEKSKPAPSPSPPKKLRGRMKPKSKSVSKKARISSPAPSVGSLSSNESEDERWVEAALTQSLPFPSMDSTKEEQDVFSVSEATIPRRTRGNRLVAISAENPSHELQHPPTTERDHATSVDGHSTRIPIRKIDLTKIPLRRSTSIPEALLMAVSRQKRKRSDSDDTECASDLNDLASSDSPLPALPIGRPRYIKRAFSLPSSDSDMRSTRSMSSDDDPHLGQVTPHHLISPALHRRPGSLSGRLLSARKYTPIVMKDLFGDELPGSDDSVATSSSSGSESDSPTKEFVIRQLQRTGSSDSISKFSSKTLIA
ncbi:hypothetical protein BDZ97DRAFT_1797269 [Flammula alnicola]|nr:hypothetical protein BDZ97DRAFT_1797269 [Flammula alnicola]